uniref:Uncharacterized protein n=1 Tax=Setaria italica TaxID=4555 RepID=K3Y425_SETIT
MRRPAFPRCCVCASSKKGTALRAREGLIGGGNLPPRRGGKAMRPRRTQPARKAPRDGPRPHSTRVGLGFALVCPPANQGTRRGEGRPRSGTGKIPSFGKGGRESGREGGEGRRPRRGQWNGR